VPQYEAPKTTSPQSNENPHTKEKNKTSKNKAIYYCQNDKKESPYYKKQHIDR
jgi:hypothetical protein